MATRPRALGLFHCLILWVARGKKPGEAKIACVNMASCQEFGFGKPTRLPSSGLLWF